MISRIDSLVPYGPLKPSISGRKLPKFGPRRLTYRLHTLVLGSKHVRTKIIRSSSLLGPARSVELLTIFPLAPRPDTCTRLEASNADWKFLLTSIPSSNNKPLDHGLGVIPVTIPRLQCLWLHIDSRVKDTNFRPPYCHAFCSNTGLGPLPIL